MGDSPRARALVLPPQQRQPRASPSSFDNRYPVYSKLDRRIFDEGQSEPALVITRTSCFVEEEQRRLPAKLTLVLDRRAALSGQSAQPAILQPVVTSDASHQMSLWSDSLASCWVAGVEIFTARRAEADLPASDPVPFLALQQDPHQAQPHSPTVLTVEHSVRYPVTDRRVFGARTLGRSRTVTSTD